MERLGNFFQCTSRWEEIQRLFHLHPSSLATEGIPLPGNLGPQLARPGAETKKVKMWVAHTCSTLCDPRDSSRPGPSIHGILQARILEWVAIPSRGDPSWPRDWTRSPALQVNFLPSKPPGTYMQLGEGEFSDWGVNSGSKNKFSGTDQTWNLSWSPDRFSSRLREEGLEAN